MTIVVPFKESTILGYAVAEELTSLHGPKINAVILSISHHFMKTYTLFHTKLDVQIGIIRSCFVKGAV